MTSTATAERTCRATASYGDLYLYPGNGTGGWMPRVTDRLRVEPVQYRRGAGDFNGDGRADLLAEGVDRHPLAAHGHDQRAWLLGRGPARAGTG